DLRRDHRADVQEANGGVGAVVDSMRTAPAARESNNLPGRERALAVERSQRRRAGQHDKQLLVRVMNVEREARCARLELEHGRTELLAACLAPHTGPSPTERRFVLLGVPLRLEDVRHAGDAISSGATRGTRRYLSPSAMAGVGSRAAGIGAVVLLSLSCAATAAASKLGDRTINSPGKVITWHGKSPDATGQGYGPPTDQSCTEPTCDS